MRKFFSLFLLLIALGLDAQEARKFQLHSHNDYLQTVPFWTAFSAGASSIEVDVILKEGKLMVAHEPETIDPRRTIESLYLDPISEGLKSGVIPSIWLSFAGRSENSGPPHVGCSFGNHETL